MAAPANRANRAKGTPDLAAWALVPLRAFLGATFVYAGLQKLADRWFFKASAPSSIRSQLHVAARTSPIGGLVRGLQHGAVLVGLVIALVELAIGVATLLGLWTRWAAGAGLVLSAGFLLTVSWHTHPYYYGADIVFVFAWTPLLIAGAGPWSVDTATEVEARRGLDLPTGPDVTVGFDVVRRLCGAFDHGRCRAQHGRKCRPAGCPVLAPGETPAIRDELERRAFLRRAGVAGWAGAAALASGGLAAIAGRLISPRRTAVQAAPALGTGTPSADVAPAAPTTTAPAAPTTSAPTPPTTTAPAVPGGTAIGPASAVPVGGAARFTDPASGDAAYVLQPSAGRFVAFDATCTHAGCPVEYSGSIFQCPCHGAEFDAHTGEVLRGPATQPLGAIQIAEGPGGTLYAR